MPACLALDGSRLADVQPLALVGASALRAQRIELPIRGRGAVALVGQAKLLGRLAPHDTCNDGQRQKHGSEASER